MSSYCDPDLLSRMLMTAMWVVIAGHSEQFHNIGSSAADAAGGGSIMA